jgi:hypothetical protein
MARTATAASSLSTRRSTSTTTVDCPAHQEETEMVSPKQAGTPRYRSKSSGHRRPSGRRGARAGRQACARMRGRHQPDLVACKTMPRPRPWTPRSGPDRAQIGPAPPAERRVAGTPSDDDRPPKLPATPPRHPETTPRPPPWAPSRAQASSHRRQSSTRRLRRRGPALLTPRRPHRHLAVLTDRPPPAIDVMGRLQNRRGERREALCPAAPFPGVAWLSQRPPRGTTRGGRRGRGSAAGEARVRPHVARRRRRRSGVGGSFSALIGCTCAGSVAQMVALLLEDVPIATR